MEPRKRSLVKQSADRFPAKAAMVLLATFILMDPLSIAGLSSSVASIFPHSINGIMSLTVCTIGLLGAYGLFRNYTAGTYFALLVAIFLTVRGCFSLVKTYIVTQVSQALATSAITTLILEPLTILNIFRIITKKMYAGNTTRACKPIEYVN